MKKRYKIKGFDAFTNGHKYLKYHKKYNDSFCKKIISIYNSAWQNSPFTTFYNALKEYYSITIPYNTLRRIMHKSGIKPPRTWNAKEKFLHKRRKERQHAGELVQMDASTHDWLMNGTKIALHGGIDDATHTVTGLYFCRNECRLGYNEVLRQTWTKYGIPQAYYIDRHSSFVISGTKKDHTFTERIEKSKTERTHFIDLCNELNIEIILALSAQGKGRIERLWQTLQGKLPFIFRFLHIDTIDKANSYIAEWIQEFNEKYSIKAESIKSCFKPIPKGYDLNYKLSVKFNCRTDYQGYFSFHDCDFILNAPYKACKRFELCLSEQDGVVAYMHNEWYSVSLAQDYLQDLAQDKMPQVEKDLIGRYLLNNIHTDYA